MKAKYLFIIILILVLFLLGYTNTTKQKVYDTKEIAIESLSLSKYKEIPETTKVVKVKTDTIKNKRLSKKHQKYQKDIENVYRQEQIDKKLVAMEKQLVMLDSLLNMKKNTIK